MFRKIPLWLWGVFLIGIAVAYQVYEGIPSFSGTPDELGAVTASIMVNAAALIAGVTLIIVHLVRRSGAPKAPKRPDGW